MSLVRRGINSFLSLSSSPLVWGASLKDVLCLAKLILQARLGHIRKKYLHKECFFPTEAVTTLTQETSSESQSSITVHIDFKLPGFISIASTYPIKFSNSQTRIIAAIAALVTFLSLDDSAGRARYTSHNITIYGPEFHTIQGCRGIYPGTVCCAPNDRECLQVTSTEPVPV